MSEFSRRAKIGEIKEKSSQLVEGLSFNPGTNEKNVLFIETIDGRQCCAQEEHSLISLAALARFQGLG
ncbi:MAG: hypothetical protein P4L51_27915 [Puia sp.]|nr:hypothetical protein [Puia sp.]